MRIDSIKSIDRAQEDPNMAIRRTFSQMIRELSKLRLTAPKPQVQKFVDSVYSYIEKQDDKLKTELLSQLKAVLKSEISQEGVVISDRVKAAIESGETPKATTDLEFSDYNNLKPAA